MAQELCVMEGAERFDDARHNGKFKVKIEKLLPLPLSNKMYKCYLAFFLLMKDRLVLLRNLGVDAVFRMVV